MAKGSSAGSSVVVFMLIYVQFIMGQSSSDEEVETTLEATPREQCYSHLGCFGLEYPWLSKDRPFSRLPDHPDVINTTFYLSTRKAKGSRRQVLRLKPELSVENVDWDSRRWTIIITHGFMASAFNPWVRDMEEALLKIRDFNVVSCDWQNGSSGVNYIRAAVNTRVVGAEVARLIKSLVDEELAAVERIHLIGHSLGAHAMSYVSASVEKVARLTALDPAQPGFEGTHPDTRVDSGDADFVDVIHTSADHFITSLGLGMMQPIGHVDFFVNGGKKQPGCYLNRGIIDKLSNIPSKVIDKFADVLACSHQKAWNYYIEALNSNCSFWGHQLTLSEEPDFLHPCNPKVCQQMVRFTSLYSARGTFYVKTNTTTPYCIPDPFSDFVMTFHRFQKSKKKLDENPFGGI